MNESKRLIFRVLCDGRNVFSFIAGIIVSGYVVEISINPDKNWLHWILVVIGIIIGFLLYYLITLCEQFESEEIKLKKDQPVSYTRNDANIQQILKCVTEKEDYKDYIIPVIKTRNKLILVQILFAVGILVYYFAEDKNKNDKPNIQTVFKVIQHQDSIINEMRLTIDALRLHNKQQTNVDSIQTANLFKVIEQSDKIIENQNKNKE